MTRRCSHCSNNGHNSRTCPTRGGSGAGVKLFGVRLTDGSSFMKKSASMGNLSLYTNPSSPTGSDPVQDPVGVPDGYLSDDPNHASCSTNRRCERKKGKPWTEKEHRLFLIGLQKLGKGDWRGIARNYVVSRTPTQVASHAQKYFIRHSNASRRKRRSSLFDMVPDTVDEDPQPRPEEQPLPTSSDPQDTENSNSFPSLNLSLSTEAEPMETTSLEPPNEPMEEPMALTSDWPPAIPSFVPTYLPIPYPFWPPAVACHEEDATTRGLNHRVLRPIPVLRKEPVNVDELVGMSHLNLRETEKNHVAPPELSLNLVGAPTRQSAFHASASVADGKNNVIRAL